jgi:hypothetical protein
MRYPGCLRYLCSVQLLLKQGESFCGLQLHLLIGGLVRVTRDTVFSKSHIVLHLLLQICNSAVALFQRLLQSCHLQPHGSVSVRVLQARHPVQLVQHLGFAVRLENYNERQLRKCVSGRRY